MENHGGGGTTPLQNQANLHTTLTFRVGRVLQALAQMGD